MAEPWGKLPTITSASEVERTPDGWKVNGRVLPQSLIDSLAPDEKLRYVNRLLAASTGTLRDERVSGVEMDADSEPQTAQESQRQEDISFIQSQGFETDPKKAVAGMDILAQLAAAGIDTDAPEIKLIIENAGETLQDPSVLGVLIPQWQQKFPAAPMTAFSQAFELSGFEGGYFPQPAPGASQLAAFERGGIKPDDLSGPVDPYRMQETTGWLQYRNGVLVDPSGTSGRFVHYDPVSKVPGSPLWFREVVAKWDEAKVVEWRKRLHEYGYLDKDATKLKVADEAFRAALQAYHDARYLNGGKPTIGDASVMAGSRQERAKLVDVREERGAQIRNTVRETYRRIYGTDPTDGEVQTFSSMIFETAMDLQRTYRRKYGDPNDANAVVEATERGIEQMENSPEATFLRESEEENTRLRDALERAVLATRGLAG